MAWNIENLCACFLMYIKVCLGAHCGCCTLHMLKLQKCMQLQIVCMQSFVHYTNVYECTQLTLHTEHISSIFVHFYKMLHSSFR